ncbi:MAG TPA: GntR family transcriptional regulator [Patescibacteria group bacterium]|nr:GntR family transcriptional regulator [Patescibacteria group bacterium]
MQKGKGMPMRAREQVIPAYYRLADDIKQKIESGELKPGDGLPTEESLGEARGISRMTVRQGLSLLLEAGLIETIKGKGSFVSRPCLNRLVIDWEIGVQLNGQEYQYRLLEVKVVRSEGEIGQILGPAPEQKIIQIKRVLLQQDQPVAIEERYLPYIKGKPLLENHLEYADFPEMIAKHQECLPVRNDMDISVALLTAEQAQQLGELPQSPAMLVRSIIYSSTGKALGVSRLVGHQNHLHLRATSYPYR